MFKDSIKILRDNQRISQSELATRLGISQSTIGMWESGRREPNFDTTKSIADYFSVPVNFLMSHGVFENWREIFGFWEIVAEYLDNISACLSKPHCFEYDFLMRLDISAKIRLVNILFSKIFYDQEKNELKMYFNEHSYPVIASQDDNSELAPEYANYSDNEALIDDTFNLKVHTDLFQRIECLLKEQGLNRKEMCINAGVDYDTFDRMVNRKSKSISLDAVKSIANYFSVPIDFLLSNGIFENWEQIIANWEDIARHLDSILNEIHESTFFKYETLVNLSFVDKINLTNITFEKVDFDSVSNKPKICFKEHSCAEITIKGKKTETKPVHFSNAITMTFELDKLAIEKYLALNQEHQARIRGMIDAYFTNEHLAATLEKGIS